MNKKILHDTIITVTIIAFIGVSFLSGYVTAAGKAVQFTDIVTKDAVFKEREHACIAVWYDGYNSTAMKPNGACYKVNAGGITFYEYPLYLRGGIFANFQQRPTDLEPIQCMALFSDNQTILTDDKGMRAGRPITCGELQ